jgi:thiol:disulfide interchange protein DsbD
VLKITKKLLLLFVLSLTNVTFANDFNTPFNQDSNSIFKKEKVLVSEDNSTTRNLFTTEEALTSEQAFILKVEKIKNNLSILIDIAPNHYLYENKIKIKINKKKYTNYEIENSVEKMDNFYGNVKVIYKKLLIKKEIKNIKTLTIEYQGCAENFNICYQPLTKTFNYDLKGEIENIKKEIDTSSSFFDFENLEERLSNSSFIVVLLIFFVSGILISFTPCILPIIPILSAIIINKDQETNNKKAFSLSFSYVMGSSTAYAVIGVIAALSGKNLQMYIQHPLFLIISSIILFILALTMFDVLNFKTSSTFNNFIDSKIQKIKQTGIFASYIIGFLSTLIVSPCVAAPLAAAVIYISSTEDVILGASALFSFGLGIGLILIIIATSLNKLSVKSGKFMNEIKYFIGFILILVSLFILERIYQGFFIDVLYYFSFLFYSISIFVRNGKKSIFLLLLLNSSYFYLTYNASIDVENLTTYKEFVSTENYIDIKSKNDIFIKVTADWCTYCKQMEKTTLIDPRVTKITSMYDNYILDVTKINKTEEDILKLLKVVAPPALIIIRDNKISYKHLGFVKSEEILKDFKKFNIEK